MTDFDFFRQLHRAALEQRAGDIAGTALWDSAFLPATHRGVTFRSQGDPILHLANPDGITRQ